MGRNSMIFFGFEIFGIKTMKVKKLSILGRFWLFRKLSTQEDISEPKICQYFWKKNRGKAIRTRRLKRGHLRQGKSYLRGGKRHGKRLVHCWGYHRWDSFQHFIYDRRRRAGGCKQSAEIIRDNVLHFPYFFLPLPKTVLQPRNCVILPTLRGFRVKVARIPIPFFSPQILAALRCLQYISSSICKCSSSDRSWHNSSLLAWLIGPASMLVIFSLNSLILCQGLVPGPRINRRKPSWQSATPRDIQPSRLSIIYLSFNTFCKIIFYEIFIFNWKVLAPTIEYYVICTFKSFFFFFVVEQNLFQQNNITLAFQNNIIYDQNITPSHCLK